MIKVSIARAHDVFFFGFLTQVDSFTISLHFKEGSILFYNELVSVDPIRCFDVFFFFNI